MRKLYKSLPLYLVLTIFNLSIAFGQNGIVVTDRSPIGFVSFSESSKLTSISDSRHVDGYVQKIGSGRFIFPVGQNRVYRPFAADAGGTTGAYYKANPESASSSGSAAFALSLKEPSISKISSVEYWDINGVNPTKLTLSWNSYSNVSELTGIALNKLGIVGWNKATNRWESLTAAVDELSLFGQPSSAASGSISTVEAIAPNTYEVYSLAALEIAAAASVFEGKLESVDCIAISGWVWDKTYPNSSVAIELLDGESVIASTVANELRSELKDSGIGTGKYGFRLNVPSGMMSDGAVHKISLRVRGRNYILDNKVTTLTCAFAGKLDGSDCYNVTGWVCNKNDLGNAQIVEILDGGNVIATVTANVLRNELKDSGIGDGKYGFTFPVPQAWRDGNLRTISARVKESSYVLPGAPMNVTCASSLFDGRLDYADCSILNGWAWDKSFTNSSVTLEIVEGATVHATVVASTYREDLKNAGYGTGNYGFRIPLPSSLKDGKAHQLGIRAKGTTKILGVQQTVTCASNQYQGSFGYIDCNVLNGWAWDKNFPGNTMTVELYEGTTVYGTAVASLYREDVKSWGYGTGNYGFSFNLPAALKDGKMHQLSMRIKDTNFILANSPRTLTCALNQYEGRIDFADCNTLSGWVWDKNLPNSEVTVELVEGSTVHATFSANLYRENLKNAGLGTGNYGFSIPLPMTLKDGKTHQIAIRAKGSTIILNTLQTSACSANQYDGRLDYADCSILNGWAWDKSFTNSSVTLEIVEGATVHATVVASTYREDLKNAGYGTGNYGFRIPLPSSLKDGKAHQLGIRAKGTTKILGVQQTVTCASNQYQGSFGYIDCNVLNGWAWDKNFPGNTMTVELYEGTTVYGTAVASLYREDVKSWGYGTGNYGFSFNLPAALKDGKMHQLSMRIKDTNFILANSPRTLTCALNQYEGRIDFADCNTLSGWVWDKNLPNSEVTVELVEGSTVHATFSANLYRENLKNAGLGTGNYGFSIPLPMTLKDGKTHQIAIRAKGSTIILNTLQTSACSANQYDGRLDYADCSILNGWAWDKSFTNSSVTLEIVEGATVHATVVASTYREDLKNAGYGTGNYGFRIPLPSSLKDGKAHQLGIRAKGTTKILGVQQTVTCASNQYQGSFGYIDCNVLNGWAWDKNFPGNTMTVELYEGTTVYGTAVASLYREDVKSWGYGTGNYGFSFNLPAALKDGKMHQLSMRIKDTNFILANSPRTITCPVVSARIAVVEDTLGVEKTNEVEMSDTDEKGMVIWPNPNSGCFKVKLSKQFESNSSLMIVDLIGRVVWTARKEDWAHYMQLDVDLSDKGSGTYFVVWRDRQRKQVKRVVVLK